ncbi:hypothetical protein LguiB_015442 [Lonicera macranthoides]
MLKMTVVRRWRRKLLPSRCKNMLAAVNEKLEGEGSKLVKLLDMEGPYLANIGSGRQELSDRELSTYQSRSTLPTVKGSLNAVGTTITANFGGVSEEELRSDPAYISYYYSNVNLNPRLLHPLLSKEDWRFAQKLQ